MKYILGKKVEMTQRFKDDGQVVPVTVVQAGPCVVTQVKTAEKDGYDAVQIGYGDAKKLPKPQKGHLRKLGDKRYLREFRIDQPASVKRGDTITVSVFQQGDKVSVTGTSKGRGFQGVVKRHGFHGSPASHGHKDQLRMPGSIGATDAARVFKGTRMAGQMGAQRVTVNVLEIAEVEAEKNLLYIKGAIPGPRTGLVLLSCEGDMNLEVPAAKAEEQKEELQQQEEATQESKQEEAAKKENPKPEEKKDKTAAADKKDSK